MPRAKDARHQSGAGRLARTRQPSIPDRRESARAVTDNAALWRSAASPAGDTSPRTFVQPKVAPAGKAKAPLPDELRKLRSAVPNLADRAT